MLITKEVKIRIKYLKQKSKDYYSELGYIPDTNGEIVVNIGDLSDNSTSQILLLCDYCLDENIKTEIKRPYYKYISRKSIHIDKDCCENCKPKKLKDITMAKYGVENIGKLKEERERRSKANRRDVSLVRENFYKIGFIPLFEDKDYINSNSKLKCKCINHPNIIQYKRPDGKGCKYCRDENNRGENHWNWNGGTTDTYEYLRHTNGMKMWKQDSLKEHDYMCYLTKEKGDLEIHHFKKPFIEILKETLEYLNYDLKEKIIEYSKEELDNMERICFYLHYKYGLGIPLTPSKHREFHGKYGYRNYSYEDWNEFIYKFWYGDNYELLPSLFSLD